MLYYPIHLHIKNRKVVVVGGGGVALRKIQGLIEAGARVTVIDPRPLKAIKSLSSSRRLLWLRRVYRRGDLKDAFLTVAATDNPKINRTVYKEAKRKKILLNVVDQPEFCDFIFPARVQRGDFLVTISTGGASPALARKVREDFEKYFGPEYEALVSLLGGLRQKLRSKGLKNYSRQFAKLVRSPILDYLRKGDKKAMSQLLVKIFGGPL